MRTELLCAFYWLSKGCASQERRFWLWITMEKLRVLGLAERRQGFPCKGCCLSRAPLNGLGDGSSSFSCAPQGQRFPPPCLRYSEKTQRHTRSVVQLPTFLGPAGLYQISPGRSDLRSTVFAAVDLGKAAACLRSASGIQVNILRGSHWGAATAFHFQRSAATYRGKGT